MIRIPSTLRFAQLLLLLSSRPSSTPTMAAAAAAAAFSPPPIADPRPGRCGSSSSSGLVVGPRRNSPRLCPSSIRPPLGSLGMSLEPATAEKEAATATKIAELQQQEEEERATVKSSPRTEWPVAVEAMPELSLDDDDAIISDDGDEEEAEAEYRRGLLTVGSITLMFASMSPALHYALGPQSGIAPPPVLLLNAAVSLVALSGLVFGGPLLEASTPLPRSLIRNREKAAGVAAAQTDAGGEASAGEGTGGGGGGTATYFGLDAPARAGLELGTWKFLGTTANLYGLSLTTADHGAFLIQLTTLIVPVVQGIMGVPIPRRIVTSIALALGGVFLFTQDPSASCASGSVTDNPDAVALGDALCVVAAGFYATYDLRLFKWGKLVSPRELITGKIATQAGLSATLLAALGWEESAAYLTNGNLSVLSAAFPLLAVVLWSGMIVNAVAPFLQVGGQQAVGPTRAQTLYASQPLWASILSYVFLGETVGVQGLVGGGAFLAALFLAATAEPPDPDCGAPVCEVE